MSHRDVGSRRLDLRRALGDALSAMPRLWIGAGGALVLLAAACLVSAFGDRPVWSVGAVAVASVLGVTAVGALARLSITPDVRAARALGLGPGGVQFGRPEIRLIGAAMLCFIFLAMIATVLALIVLAISGAAELDVAAIQRRDWAGVGPAWRLAVVATVVAAALVIPLVLAVRLSLFAPATLGRRQMVSLNSMGIAYGSFRALLAGLAATSLPTITLVILLWTETLSGVAASVAWVVGLAWLQMPLTMAFLGAAYRQLEYWSPDGVT